jgi:hypothetical protein
MAADDTYFLRTSLFIQQQQQKTETGGKNLIFMTHASLGLH